MKKTLSIFAGILILIMGILTLFAPVRTLTGLTIFMGITALIGGILGIASYLIGKKEGRSSTALLLGVTGIIIGLLILAYIGVSAVLLLAFFGLWILISSVSRIADSFELKKSGSTYWGFDFAIGGVLTILSLWILWHPFARLVLLDIYVSLALMVFGISVISSAFIIPKKKLETKENGLLCQNNKE